MLTIAAVRGRVLRVKDSKNTNPNLVVEYTLARDCKVFLNEKEANVADLDNGDRVILANGNSEGYHRVEATREKAKGVAGLPNLAQPRKVLLTDDQAKGIAHSPTATSMVEPGPGGEDDGHPKGEGDQDPHPTRKAAPHSGPATSEGESPSGDENDEPDASGAGHLGGKASHPVKKTEHATPPKHGKKPH